MRYATVANPRRRYSRRRRNPGGASGFVSGIKHTAKGIVAPTLAGGVGGVLAGLLDGKLGNKGPVISSLAKLGMGVAGATLLRKNAHAAYAFFGATVGSIGYPVGVKISGSGGVVAATKAQLFHGLADVASEDGEMAAMLAGSGVEDLGDLVQLGDIASDEGALSAYVDEVQGLADSDASDAELEDLVEG